MLLLEREKIGGTLETIHFIGIGGIGMSGIAEVMHNLGYKVQGSDIVKNNNTARLQAYGIQVFHGHAAKNITHVAYVVISSEIKSQNIEVQAALSSKIPVITRAEMLAELMRLKTSVAISGSHGKTTTTSLVACLFESAGLNPTVINGGIINNKATNAYIGIGDYLIAEADESDATFIKVPATIAVITNIDHEHMDFYKNFATLVNAFKFFISNLPFYGFAVACVDDLAVKTLVKDILKRKIITYGIESHDANIRAFNINCDLTSSTFDVKITLPNTSGSTTIEQVTIPVPGKHNVLNTLAAIAIGTELDFGIKVIKDGFKNFNGVKRRFSKIGEYRGASIIDDYAHHPAEIKATLATARAIADAQSGKVIAVFQPHRYSRLKYLFNDFTTCFDDTDQLYITEVYSAGEAIIQGFSGSKLVDKIILANNHAQVRFIDSYKLLPQIIKDNASSGDLIVMMGAGNISYWSQQLLQELGVT